MDDHSKYSINLDQKFGFLELIDVPALVKSCRDEWSNQTLGRINDSLVRLGVLKGEFHWHKHLEEDEFFFVLEGELLIDVEEKETVTLKSFQGYAVPRGVLHRTRAPHKTIVLMVEGSTVQPTGD